MNYDCVSALLLLGDVQLVGKLDSPVDNGLRNKCDRVQAFSDHAYSQLVKKSLERKNTFLRFAMPHFHPSKPSSIQVSMPSDLHLLKLASIQVFIRSSVHLF
jgi:hypothetical protein